MILPKKSEHCWFTQYNSFWVICRIPCSQKELTISRIDLVCCFDCFWFWLDFNWLNWFVCTINRIKEYNLFWIYVTLRSLDRRRFYCLLIPGVTEVQPIGKKIFATIFFSNKNKTNSVMLPSLRLWRYTYPVS